MQPFDPYPIVVELVERIVTNSDDPRLVWREDRQQVSIRIGHVVQYDRPTHEVRGRRRQFSRLLAARLKEHGWNKTARMPHTFLRAGAVEDADVGIYRGGR